MSKLREIAEVLNANNRGTDSETLAEEITRRVTENVADLLQPEEKPLKENDFWVKSEEAWVCRPCLNFANSKERPMKLNKFYKFNFGVLTISKQGDDSTRQSRKNERQSRHTHESSALHIWCAQMYKDNQKERDMELKRNEEGAEKIVTNILFCLQNSLSAHAYRKMNNKDALRDKDFPTKNDGIQSFFQVRDLAYDSLLQTMSEKLKSVRSASFSLDKVTVRMVPYTVLVTYFFHDGKLNTYLNAVYPMKSDQYSGEETAKFVGKELMRTLNLTRHEVATKFVHSCYDGVYASKEERSRGGGCLR